MLYGDVGCGHVCKVFRCTRTDVFPLEIMISWLVWIFQRRRVSNRLRSWTGLAFQDTVAKDMAAIELFNQRATRGLF